MKYVKKRLLVIRIFREVFSDIKDLARKTLSREEQIKETSFIGETNFNAFELSNLGIRSTIALILGEEIRGNSEDMLMEKMNSLYELLMEEEYALIFQPLNLIRPFAELEDNGNENLILEDVIIVEGKCIDFMHLENVYLDVDDFLANP